MPRGSDGPNHEPSSAERRDLKQVLFPHDGLFRWGRVTLHSGQESNWIINCEALTDDDLDCLARMYAAKYDYGEVHGVPRGGLRFAEALSRYSKHRQPLLIADDVFTTGSSMLEMWKSLGCPARTAGVCIFARGQTPPWPLAAARLALVYPVAVTALFRLGL